MLSRRRQTGVDVLGMLTRFLEMLIESENFVFIENTRTKTALRTLQL